MKQLLIAILTAIGVLTAQAGDESFTITVTVDSAIASVPQKLYMYTMVQRRVSIEDSIAIDSLHRTGTLRGSLPFEYYCYLLFAQRGPAVVPVIAKNGDSITLHVGDEDDGFSTRWISRVEGSPAHVEYVRYQNKRDSLDNLARRVQTEKMRHDLTDAQVDSLEQLRQQYAVAGNRLDLRTALETRDPFIAYMTGRDVYSTRQSVFVDKRETFTEDEVDNMMHALKQRYPDYPPIQLLVNDSTVGNYMSATSFAMQHHFNKTYSARFRDEYTDTTVQRLHLGDYLNLPVGPGGNTNASRGKYVLVDFWASWCQPCLNQLPNIKLAAERYKDDLVVVMVSMDKSSKAWWTAVKEYGLRGELYNHGQAYNNHGKMHAAIKRLGIDAIPHNYLADRSGRIIAMNISGWQLVEKMAELIKKEAQQ